MSGSPSSRCSPRRSARPSRPPRPERAAVQGVRRATLPPLPAEVARAQALDHRRQVRLAAVRLHRRAGQERRLRRRDREVVLALRVRPGEPRHVHLRHDAGPRARADERAGRPRDRDVHVHGRPRHADRLLAGRTTRRPGGCSSGTTRRSSSVADLARQDDRDDPRLDLRPLGAATASKRRSCS